MTDTPTPHDLPAPWPARLRHYAALQRQSSHAAQARVQHHAICACSPDQPCLVGGELRDWETDIADAIARYQRHYADAPPPLPPTWLRAFSAWYGDVLTAHRLSTAEPLSPLEQQTRVGQVRRMTHALARPAHADHRAARWLYEAWLAVQVDDTLTGHP